MISQDSPLIELNSVYMTKQEKSQDLTLDFLSPCKLFNILKQILHLVKLKGLVMGHGGVLYL